MQFIKQYDNLNVTILNVNDEIYFRGKEVATILGYANTTKAVFSQVEPEDKKTFEFLIEKGQVQILPTFYIDKKAMFINESGLYSLILRSNKENAKSFKKWVTSEVLPSIRKSGEYKINKDEQDTKKITKITAGINILEKLGMLTDRDKLFLGSQVKNLLFDEKLMITNDEYEYPLTRRLADHKINYNNKMKNNLIKAGIALKKFYFQKYNKYPEKKNQYVDNATRLINVYTNKDFDIMDKALLLYFDFI